MVGVVVATHGALAEALIRTAEGIVGRLEQCKPVSIASDASMDATRDSLEEAIRAVRGDDGVLVLTDMFGGTPSNLALTFLDEGVEVVTGVNLPMLLKLSTSRTQGLPLSAIGQVLTAHGQKNITLASELLRTRTESKPRS
jgi:PTS system mannose-specific IIA component